MYKALSLCIEGTYPDNIPPQPLLETSVDVVEMAVSIFKKQQQHTAYSQVIKTSSFTTTVDYIGSRGIVCTTMANCYISVLKSFASVDVSEWFKGFGICSRASE